MSKYSILTCIFSNYEMVREVSEPNPEIEYILVTDNPNLESKTWKILYYPQLLDYPEGPDRWAYIRYHPFEFVNTNICLYIDGSIQIKKDPVEMLRYFENHEWEYGTLQNTIVNDIRTEVNRWAYYGYYGFSTEDANRVIKFLDNVGYSASGLLQSTMIIYKNTEFTRSINNHTWTTMFLWGHDGHVDRINQTALTYAVSKTSWHDNRFILMHPRFLWSKWFEYCYHNSPISQKEGFSSFVNMSKNLKDDKFEFQNKEVSPWIPEIEGKNCGVWKIEDRLDFILYLIDKFKYEKYLEIGVNEGYCYNKIHINKTGVDPNIESPASLHVTSDEFFTNNNEKFDIIFIDGLHQYEQVYRDIINSLDILNPGGTIICHDMWPETEEMASHEQGTIVWNGDCYKALLQIVGERDDLLIHVFYDLDEGTTIIRKTVQNSILKKNVSEWNINVEQWHNTAFNLGLAMSINEYMEKSEEIVICAIAKQEKKYLKTWCQWHLDIGFDRIYLYDNNDPESDEEYKEFEKIFPGQIEVRMARGLKSNQITQYQSFCDDNIYKWVAFIDIDEFINFKEGIYSNIREFLESIPDKDAFILQWRCYHANRNIEPINKPIYKYCTEPISSKIRKDSRPENMNGWYKTISRSGISLNMNEHTVWPATATPIKVSDCFGNDTNANFFKWRNGSEDTVWVNHYIIKNIEDFYYNKYKRGHAGIDLKSEDGYTWWCWNQNINYFTDIQGPLSEKEQLFLMSKGMKPNWIFRPRMTVLCHQEPFNTPWYSSRKSELIRNFILPNTDIELIMCGDPKFRDGAQYYNGVEFLDRMYYYYTYGSCWMMDIPECETYGQPQLIFNMGYDMRCPIDCDDNTKLNILNSTINSFFNTTSTWRGICERVIENPRCMVVLKGTMEYDVNCAGYKDIVDEFLSKYGYENKHFRIKNNTYVTSRENYLKIRELWVDFANTYGYADMKELMSSRDNGNSTIYDAWQFILPCITEEIEIID